MNSADKLRNIVEDALLKFQTETGLQPRELRIGYEWKENNYASEERREPITKQAIKNRIPKIIAIIFEK